MYPSIATRAARRLAVTAIALVLGVVSACDTGPSSSPASSTAPPSTSESPTSAPPSSSTPVAIQRHVAAYYIGDTTRGARLFRETHTVTTTLGARAAAVAEALADPLDPDYVTGWASLGVSVNSVTKSDGVITVDLHGLSGLRDRPPGMRAKIASSAVDQILWTVRDTVKAPARNAAVQLLADGSHIDRLLGIPVAEPLAFPDPGLTLAQVWITNIQEGDTVTSPVTVEGLGAAFEAQIVWRVYDESGSVVKHGWTLAEECCRMAPFSFTVRLAPGAYLIVVEDNDPSGGEAPGPWQDSKAVTVS